jgi:hypothetical protein
MSVEIFRKMIEILETDANGRQCISSLDCKKKKIKVNGGAFMGSKVVDALLNDERGIK